MIYSALHDSKICPQKKTSQIISTDEPQACQKAESIFAFFVTHSCLKGFFFLIICFSNDFLLFFEIIYFQKTEMFAQYLLSTTVVSRGILGMAVVK